MTLMPTRRILLRYCRAGSARVSDGTNFFFSVSQDWISKFEAKYGVVGFVTDGIYVNAVESPADAKKDS